MTPDVSIVVPAYNEGPNIVGCLDGILACVTSPCEVLVVYDSPDDTTAPLAQSYAASEPRVVPTLNTYGRGPANAIRFGMDAARAPVIVVTMADGSDEAHLIDQMVDLVARGAVVVAASRYMRGGRQVGGARMKRTLSRAAGVSLWWLGRVGTHDATSAFKAYSTAFVRSVGVESAAGFEIALELVSKAKRMGLPVAEIPTTWRDRTQGTSNFKVTRWLPKYLRWYLLALAPRRVATGASRPLEEQ